MLVTELGIVILVRLLQPENAPLMFVTELGIVILVKPLQFENALLPMLVTELGIMILVKPLQPKYPLIVDYQYFVSNTIEE